MVSIFLNVLTTRSKFAENLISLYFYLLSLFSYFTSIIPEILAISYINDYRFSNLLFKAYSIKELNFILIWTYIIIILLSPVIKFLLFQILHWFESKLIGIFQPNFKHKFLNWKALLYVSIKARIIMFETLTMTLMAFIYVFAIYQVALSKAELNGLYDLFYKLSIEAHVCHSLFLCKHN